MQKLLEIFTFETKLLRKYAKYNSAFTMTTEQTLSAEEDDEMWLKASTNLVSWPRVNILWSNYCFQRQVSQWDFKATLISGPKTSQSSLKKTVRCRWKLQKKLVSGPWLEGEPISSLVIMKSTSACEKKMYNVSCGSEGAF